MNKVTFHDSTKTVRFIIEIQPDKVPLQKIQPIDFIYQNFLALRGQKKFELHNHLFLNWKMKRAPLP
ncbi:MAG: hypothetical protein AB1515_10250, partial [Nitrospirota bacterium]